MSLKRIAENALQQGRGILRLSATWVPRTFCVPGRRLRLHPDDYYSLGGQRGGIDERWLSSTVPADNGPLTAKYEGLSHVVFTHKGKTDQILLRDAVEELKGQLIGERIWKKHQGWPMFSKFFDNKGAIPHHIHQDDKYAGLVGQKGKPEAYFFPPQMNNYDGDFPYTFFGLNPDTTREQLKQCLMDFAKGDNKLTSLSRAYRLQVGTGWDIPAGVLHAPGSLCTYEAQVSSDVFAMYQSLVGDSLVPEELLWRSAPQEKLGDFDHLINVLDWEANVDPDFASKHFMAPSPVAPKAEMEAAGYIENWICYKSQAFSAKELSVLPGRTAKITDNAAYGLIMMQGHGTMDHWPIETPSLIRVGQLTNDEYFVSQDAARRGPTITNSSDVEPLIMLKHFGPENPDLVL